MTGLDIKVRFNLAKVLIDPTYFTKEFTAVFQASSFIAERHYVKETPVDKGDYKGTIRTQKKGLQYIVTSKARSKDGREYPRDLYMGTGRLKGAPDFGFTTGRVRAGQVALGIGGIRPNKVAKRAKERAEDPVIRFINKGVQQMIKKK